MGSSMLDKKVFCLESLVAESGLPPSLQPAALTAIRAYTLAWSFNTAPALLTVVIKALLATSKQIAKSSDAASAIAPLRKVLLVSLPRVLRRSVFDNGLPILFAAAIAGHHFLSYALKHHLKKRIKTKKDRDISTKAAVFLSAAATMLLVRRVFPNNKTLDLTFFALVRALDVIAHRLSASPAVRERVPGWLIDNGSVAVFTLACTEIMFAWFYAPERLPKSYSRWISEMSQMDDRLLVALRAIRDGKWVYGKDTGMQHLLGDFCEELGLPREMGDPRTGRLPCQVVHHGQPYGCEVFSMNRFAKGFIKIFPLYFTVHAAPRLLFRPSSVLRNPSNTLLRVLQASSRSSAFIATFITIIWYSICLVRTRIGHQLLGVDQSRLDNTLAPLVGCSLCGLSLLIESKSRRGEMALHAVPRALYSFTERLLGPYQKGRQWESIASTGIETLVFASSMAVIVDAMHNDQSNVRSSVRSLLSWIMRDELKCKEKKDP